MEARLRLTLAYLGTNFAGWQKQRGVRTVQGELEAALGRLYGHPVLTVGAGRTDAGVHAEAQVVHLDPPLSVPPLGVLRALNAFAPWDIRILEVQEVPSTFHARCSAVGKRYRYRLAWGKPLPPWEALRRVWLPRPPDFEKLAAALSLYRGEHDFASFSLTGHSGRGERGTVRKVFASTLLPGTHRADIVVEGDGFLRGMVRRLVGAALEVAQGRRDIAWLDDLLGRRGSPFPAPTAPAHGLTLEKVFYRRPRHW